MRKGDLILIPFPFTDLSGQKVRPALVLSVSKKGEDCVVVFISSVKSKAKSGFDVSVKASQVNGLKVDSVIKVDKIATLQKKIALGEIGVLESPIIRNVERTLKKLFQL